MIKKFLLLLIFLLGQSVHAATYIDIGRTLSQKDLDQIKSNTCLREVELLTELLHQLEPNYECEEEEEEEDNENCE
tara:strand:- start:27 stop:254 length:228 start_codon:yes stop_codon:yes gene_type:complete